MAWRKQTAVERLQEILDGRSGYRISVSSTSPVVFCEERAENLGAYDQRLREMSM